jgi:hypothetical protein
MAKTKTPVEYTSSGSDKPQVGDTMIFDGKEFIPGVSVSGESFWEVTNGKIYSKAPFNVIIGDITSYEAALLPRTDLIKDIGSESLRFRDIYTNKVVATGEYTLKGGSPSVIKWISTTDGNDKVYKNAAGNTKIKMLQNGDMVFFVDESEEES